MQTFRPRAITFQGLVPAARGVDEVFPLFSPEGERLWVPGWDPELLHPPDTEWAQGQIFRTQEENGEAVWIVTRLDRGSHEAEYHRVEPGRYVARVRVRCRPRSNGAGTDTSIAYSFVGLSEAGNRDVDAMSEEEFDAKMARWARWIEEYWGSR